MIFSYSAWFLIRWSLGLTRQSSSLSRLKTLKVMAAAVFLGRGSSRKFMEFMRMI